MFKLKGNFGGQLTGLLVACLLFTGCQTTQEKNQALVRDRYEKLRGLSTWKPTWCRVEATLTQPALARYAEMFPEESEKRMQSSWSYTWRARESACEVTSLETSPLSKNHRSFLEAAFCTLLQTHFVNSPFDEMQVKPEEILDRDGKVQIRTGGGNDLGMFLDPKTVTVETHTKSRGILKAVYTDRERQWLPERIEQQTKGAVLLLDNFEYDEVPLGGRRMIKSFSISVGDARAFAHTQVQLSNCQNF